MKKLIQLINTNILISLVTIVCISTTYTMNLLQPYDTLIRPPFTGRYKWQVALFAEHGFDAKAFLQDSRGENVLQIWHADQNTLKMLEGFDVNTPIGQKRIELDAEDDGTRGHLCVDGRLKLDASVALGVRYGFMRDWSVGIYVPFYSMKLTNVLWCDQTENITDEDRRVKDLLMQNFCEQVFQLGDGLCLQDWHRKGAGDVTILFEWFRDFPQHKPILKNVHVNWRGGLILPAGERQDEDKILAVPFGLDGAFGLPFGLGLDLALGRYLNIGLDVQLTQIFGNTRLRRIKTHVDQTELLLLQKARAHKDFGLIQRFNLNADFHNESKSFTMRFGYQFQKHGQDELTLTGYKFSSEIANTAVSLRERTMHHIILKASYDVGKNMKEERRLQPHIALYARLPIEGKRVALFRTIGAVLTINF